VQLTLNSTRKNNEESPIEGVAFSTPKNQRVLVIHNRDPNKAFTGIITDSKFPGQAVVELGPKSINTFVWQKPSGRISVRIWRYAEFRHE
jgi:O-glycosyl hydrolase